MLGGLYQLKKLFLNQLFHAYFFTPALLHDQVKNYVSTLLGYLLHAKPWWLGLPGRLPVPSASTAPSKSKEGSGDDGGLSGLSSSWWPSGASSPRPVAPPPGPRGGAVEVSDLDRWLVLKHKTPPYSPSNTERETTQLQSCHLIHLNKRAAQPCRELQDSGAIQQGQTIPANYPLSWHLGVKTGEDQVPHFSPLLRGQFRIRSRRTDLLDIIFF